MTPAQRHMGRKPIPGFEGRLEADAEGNVFSVDWLLIDAAGRRRQMNGKKLKPFKVALGYYRVSVGPKAQSVHRLVCLAFHGLPPAGKPYTNHKNGIKSDNRAINLEWVSASENELHSIQVLGKAPPQSMLGKFGALHNRAVSVVATDTDGNVVVRFGSMHEAQRAGFTATRICACLAGRSATHRGLLWNRDV